ncbi:copper homeostasis protein CutC [Pseudoxanthomonas winnipegensis]|uniref:PF03932 family protein CutC n=1 Tax=Pseudoxanthomonas winnipegensis TaxID=2480810 RepID=A0A4Q8M1X8_9GAMM|nr:copper homeostasis protein CutC [Pseudoxanthomonas winnipegensis]RZZ86804.1 copper homeostasis protein CutC [Pseudoxanthomonas winnipegensis]TAA38024.1 copper homeostasis protein CutC [Pseudoxanthomonas winnipegensis]
MAERVKLEIAANALESALAAQAGGADRVELCENLGEGGCTPSYGTLALARERLSIPLYVLVRPRGGDFVYSPAEWEVMRRDVALCVRLGCDGVVIGALTAGGEIDTEVCASLVAAAGPLGVTFHRAFDSVRDPQHALEQIIALGCERVLTSGQAAGAPQGAAAIAAARAQAAGRLSVMAGAGLAVDNVAELVRRTGVGEVHASAKAFQAGQGSSDLPGLEGGYWRTDADQVRALRARLDEIAANQA